MDSQTVPGISRRDFFAAHAPPVADDFDLADPLPFPPKPASVAAYDALDDVRRRDFTDCPDGQAEATAWYARRGAHIDAMNADRDAWAAENRRVKAANALAREVAWRWHWADVMLAVA